MTILSRISYCSFFAMLAALVTQPLQASFWQRLFPAQPLALMACDATLMQDGQSNVTCVRNQVASEAVEALTYSAHEARFETMGRSPGVERCYREEDKSRLQQQMFTVCVFDKGRKLTVFVTTRALDARQNIYLLGAKLDWYQNDLGVFLYRRYFKKAASYGQWLLDPSQ